MLRVFRYVVAFRGGRKVETFARNKEAAIKMVMAAYPGAPRSIVTARRIATPKRKRRRR